MTCNLFGLGGDQSDHGLSLGITVSDSPTATHFDTHRIVFVTSRLQTISVTSVLSRKLEQYVLNQFLYPVMHNSHSDISFSDQYAFRPTGSTTAAIIAVMDKVTELLDTGEVVIMLTLDFSKAFDMVRHKTMFDKFSKLDINDKIYNWLTSYFEGRDHTTKFKGHISEKSPLMPVSSKGPPWVLTHILSRPQT